MVERKKYDIVIVGAGPVGLLLSTCLTRWGYRIKHIDNRAEPTPTGRADGIQPRSLHLLRNMGLKSQIMAHRPARVFEVAFWDPQPQGGIARSGTWPSCPSFIDARYPFTTLLHQGLIERIFIADMGRNGTQVQRPWTIVDFSNDSTDPGYPIEVKLAHVDGLEQPETIRTKYLFSAEGGKSSIRQKLGISMRYKDPISYVWGVMDGIIKTDFPDIKMKCTIHSEAGSIMVIPREANMVRLYIMMASSEDTDFDPRKQVSAHEVQQKAKAILKPYSIEWETLEWYSVYPIGQGIAERYTLDERVFLGGDACHTHSPKAGQGMNAAFLDAMNFSWKLHHVESGFASRSLLKSYEQERRHVAESLLDFDSRYARLFSERQPASGEVSQANQAGGGNSHTEENPFVKTFKESCEFTSGYGVAYPDNPLNWSSTHPAQSPLFLRYPETTTQRPGRIMTAATVIRVVDANVVHLEQEVPVDGSWRIFVFAGAPSTHDSPPLALASLAEHATKPGSFLDPSLHQKSSYQLSKRPRFASLAIIFAAKRPEVDIDNMLPPPLSIERGRVYADDLRDLRALDALAAAHAKMGFDSSKGGVVVVRPDGHVGCVVGLTEGKETAAALDAYFHSFGALQRPENLQRSSSTSKRRASSRL